MAKQAKTRKCIVCRNEFQKEELFRFVKNLEDEVLFDVFYKAPGKGAYVCNNNECTQKALDKKIIGNILKASQPENLKEQMQKALKVKILGNLSMLNKAGMLIFGTEKSLEAIKFKKAKTILLAEDSSANTKEKFENSVSKNNIQLFDFLEKNDFEGLNNTANTTVIVLQDSKLTENIKRLIKSYKTL